MAAQVGVSRSPSGSAALPRAVLFALRADRELSVDDWYALPETPERYELFEGMLVMVPPSHSAHQAIETRLGGVFDQYAIRTASGRAFTSPIGVELAPGIAFEPDVVFVAEGSAATVTERGISGPPDIVVEISSPSTRRYDRDVKLPTYLEHGVREVWIVDPAHRTIALFGQGSQLAPFATVGFGEQIPSTILDVGDAFLGLLPEVTAPKRAPRKR